MRGLAAMLLLSLAAARGGDSGGRVREHPAKLTPPPAQVR